MTQAEFNAKKKQILGL
ncbi:hypothetical protein [Lacticaseibacillus manihotivorans]|uniref:Uncharacterized protein n=1 Tax=Lacticaseibacillus manihotivorans TaxID=88233 RepID=A0A5P8JWC1_9LACO|nr:hypothetical protein LM010_10355 [Lacticaseibacillus manihotivorans]